MTATVPDDSRTDGHLCSVADIDETAKRHGSRLPEMSITLGALSIGSFWIVGLGFLLGLSAIACGAIAASRSAVAVSEVASLRALLGVVAGVAGITVSAIAVIPMLAPL